MAQKNPIFHVGAGMTTPRGKPTYPVQIHVYMDRRATLELIRDLAHQLSLESRDPILAVLFGKFEK